MSATTHRAKSVERNPVPYPVPYRAYSCAIGFSVKR